ncbi:hypothetical protein JF550_02960 [Microbacterium esteraromaticum]|uniref:Uncharacterized protein n=1 Tax=Microbacterium esteraromaticum TaxID=57043 RepID=A0A939DTW4_9MICO|nr:hypothetical protein [Microbacterium esteraromaticum]MBN8204914.1 hypothetical protein [Microbacterium esteraromaticum]MBN8415068.1 hypothetical protein [Microbacterium esteraromaticum]
MSATRMLLWAVGAAGIAYGAWLLMTTQNPQQLLGVAVWLVAAVVVHDALLVPLLTAAHRGVDAVRDGARRRRARGQ